MQAQPNLKRQSSEPRRLTESIYNRFVQATTWLIVGALTAGALVLAGLAYWELVIAEGAHLGQRVVVLLYDWAAQRYEFIKKFDAEYEDRALGQPLALALRRTTPCHVLDVAAGTGRLARSLLSQPAFAGAVVNLDLSRAMLLHTRHHQAQHERRVHRVQSPASRLPFADDTFHAVSFLEALEFLPDRKAAAREAVRVLRPGGWLLLSNRVGPDVPWLSGMTFSRPEFLAMLSELGLCEIDVQPWELDYDLAWARKPL